MRVFSIAALLPAGIVLASLFLGPSRADDAVRADEAVARARNLARAHYQNEHYARAAERYRECVAIAPDSIVDRINLAVAEVQAHENDRARQTLMVARQLGSRYPHVWYLLGMVHLRLGEMNLASNAYAELLESDPLCVPALYSRGLALEQHGRKPEAVEQWQRAIALDPDHGPSYYQLFRYFTSTGQTEEATRAFEEFSRIKEAGLGPGMTRGAVDRSRYLALIEETVLPPDPGAAQADVAVTLAQAELGDRAVLAGSSPVAALGDLDGDGDLDLVHGDAVLLNEKGRFSHSTRWGTREDPRCVQLGDVDNDGHLDLVAASPTLTVLRGDGLGGFQPIELPPPDLMDGHDVRLVDIDHEGDLDILMASRDRGVRLLQNNGNGTFSDVSGPSGLGAIGGTVTSVVVSDLETDHDIDVLVAEARGAHRLLVNERDGTFKDVTKESKIDQAGPVTSVVAGDVNNDGTPDLVFFGGVGQPVRVWLNEGRATFHLDRASPVLTERTQSADVESGCVLDLDNDGDLDLVTAGGTPMVFRNDGAGGWSDWSSALAGGDEARTRFVLGGDLDDDGDVDLLFAGEDGRIQGARNDGGNANHRVRIRLAGTKNTLDGYGCKVWTRQGNFFQVRETFERWIELGVGSRQHLDVVGVRWPTGVTQNVLDVVVGDPPVIEITERPGLSESCPFVYAFDGERFSFVTDVLDVTPLGVSLQPGDPFEPNHREAILIGPDQLAPHRDRLLLRITQELSEISFLDKVELIAVEHPDGSAVVPNDRFSLAPFASPGLHYVSRPAPPVAATDEEGRDILPTLLAADRIYADHCEPISPRYPGVTDRHALILDPGPVPAGAQLRLFLRGSMLWTEASVNVAISQNPDIALLPVSLAVIGPEGSWVRVREDLGVPAGIDKFLPVDLSGVFLTADRRVRIATSFAILWDQAFFSIDVPGRSPAGFSSTTLGVLRADLHYRGFSAFYSPDGQLPDLYDYHQILPVPLFEDAHAGWYTRYGDVTELLHEIDDHFVVLAPGDEIAIEFPAILLPDLPAGWIRHYVLEVEGWIKDGDLRTLCSETVGPLPFHAMSSYPPAPQDASPDDMSYRRYLDEYQIRILPRKPRSPRYP